MEQVAARPGPGMVLIPRPGFLFCRWSTALALWLAWIYTSWPLVAACAAILIVNAIVGIQRAPLIQLGALLLRRLAPQRFDSVDPQAMRFAHLLAGLLLALSAGLLYFAPQMPDGRVLLLWIAAFKTVGALGFCSVTQFFHCVLSGSMCCGIGRKPGQAACTPPGAGEEQRRPNQPAGR